MRTIAILFLMLFVLLNCTQNQPEATTSEPPAASDTKTTADATEPPPAASEIMEKDGLKVYPLTNSPVFPDARLNLIGFENGAKMSSGTQQFDFMVSNYKLGDQTDNAGENGLANSAQGQHIHLILNNDPYSAHYETAFAKELADGNYVALAFLSRSYHESVKADGAVVLRQFTVGDVEATPADFSAPHMFYSRPKGTYSGEGAQKIMIDWYLFNVELSKGGNNVRATVNGVEFLFDTWQPYVVEGLPMGEITFKLELVDSTGAIIPGPFNSVTRTVTLSE